MPHPEYIEQFSPGYHGPIEMVTHEFFARQRETWRSASAEDVRRVRALYDNEVRYMDDSLGAHFRNLDKWGLTEKTILVFTSDHGDEQFEHGVGHRYSLYSPEIHVPLIVVYPPRIPQGVRVHSIARSLDIFPTVLDLAGISLTSRVSAEIQGRSLIPDLKEPPPDIAAVSEDSEDRQFSLRTSRYQYIVVRDSNTREELFNIEQDPLEERDLSASLPELTMQLRQRLAQEISQLHKVRRAGRAEDHKLDPDTIERLRSLGYLK
jgi:arylsulfatase A-like enzyme